MSHFLAAHPSNPLTKQVIGAAITVHRTLGPGLYEYVYEDCLLTELLLLGHQVRQQVAFPVIYRGLHLQRGFRMDLLVDEELVVEVKAVDKLGPAHRAQVLTYLRFSGHTAGLILNFNAPYLADGGIRRVLLDSGTSGSKGHYTKDTKDTKAHEDHEEPQD